MKQVLLSSLWAVTAFAVQPQVQLSYATYQGVADGNVSHWLGMRYAAPPVGSLRFAEPQPVPPMQGVQNASQHGAICLGLDSGTPAGYSEDCLFIDVWAPTAANRSSKLPVYFWMQGGGWTTDASPNINGTTFVQSSGLEVITVFLNYRVGPYGFLGGRQFSSGVSGTAINNGIKDQIAALAWIRDNIDKFGGDPDHVTIGGSSAGAGSIAAILTAYGGRNETLNKMYHAAAAESAFGPQQYTTNTSQFQYDDIVNATHCHRSSDEATIACLRSVNITQFQKINGDYDLPGRSKPPLFEYGPVLGGSLWPEAPYLLFQKGQFNKDIPTIFGDSANGGSVFVPKSTQTEAEMNTFLQNNFPALTDANLQEINKLYTPTNVPHIAPPGNTTFGAYYNTVAKVYGDMAFTCVGILASQSYTKAGSPAWQYLWNTTVPAEVAAGRGAEHVSEQSAIFGPTAFSGAANFGEPTNTYTRDYWISFVRTGDPSALRALGAPAWQKYDAQGTRLLFENGPAGAVDDVPDKLQTERCQYLISIGAGLGQ